MEMIRFVFSALLTAGGLFFLLSGVVGIFKFRYVMNRLHAAAVYDTAGAILMLSGLMLAFGWDLAALKMLLCLAFLWLTSPVCSHLVARMEITINDRLAEQMEVTDPEAVEHEKEGD